MDLLLSTKITTPRTQAKLVERRHLVAQLNSGLSRRLTLVSVPAGFGKTTLVAAWADGLGLPAAWLSVDEGDNDPVRFLSYLIAAFGHTDAELSDHSLASPNNAATPRPEAVLTALINALNRVTDDRLLVLDDYHLVELRAADLRFTEAEALAFVADVMGLTLRPQDAARLTRRTEGWIVGLQMEAIPT